MLGAVAVVRNTGSKLRTVTTEQRTGCIELRTDRRDRRPKLLTKAGKYAHYLNLRPITLFSPKTNVLWDKEKQRAFNHIYLGSHDRKKVITPPTDFLRTRHL